MGTDSRTWSVSARTAAATIVSRGSLPQPPRESAPWPGVFGACRVALQRCHDRARRPLPVLAVVAVLEVQASTGRYNKDLDEPRYQSKDRSRPASEPDHRPAPGATSVARATTILANGWSIGGILSLGDGDGRREWHGGASGRVDGRGHVCQPSSSVITQSAKSNTGLQANASHLVTN